MSPGKEDLGIFGSKEKRASIYKLKGMEGKEELWE
jgi:hypothetical protein